jgi:hypothetical protein
VMSGPAGGRDGVKPTGEFVGAARI